MRSTASKQLDLRRQRRGRAGKRFAWGLFLFLTVMFVCGIVGSVMGIRLPYFSGGPRRAVMVVPQ